VIYHELGAILYFEDGLIGVSELPELRYENNKK